MGPTLQSPWLEIKESINSSASPFDWRHVSILDLGSGNYDCIFRFYESVGFGKYVAVDEEIPVQAMVAFDRFVSYRNEGFLNVPELNREEFDERFALHYGCKMQVFLSECREQFDIVVLSNVLHLKDVKNDWEALVKAGLACLKPGGYCYIKVFTTEYNDATVHFTKSELQALVDLLGFCSSGVEESPYWKKTWVLAKPKEQAGDGVDLEAMHPRSKPVI